MTSRETTSAIRDSRPSSPTFQVERRLVRRARFASLLGPGLMALVVAAMLGTAVLLFLSVLLYSVPMVSYFVILPLLVAGIVLRAMWFRTPMPEGVELDIQRGAKLAKMLEETSTMFKAHRFSRVVVRARFGGEAVSLRRGGPLSRKRCLLLDYPVLVGLTFDDMALLVAEQELLLSGGAARLLERCRWMAMLRERLLRSFCRGLWFRPSLVRESTRRGGELHRERWLLRLFEPFFSWYFPLLEARVTALQREEVLEADRVIAERVGKRALARLLVRMAVLDTYISGTYLPRVLSRASTELPPIRPFARMEAAMAAMDEGPGDESALGYRVEGFQGSSWGSPWLKQRLRALGGVAGTIEPATGQNAGRRILGLHLDDLARALDDLWLDD